MKTFLNASVWKPLEIIWFVFATVTTLIVSFVMKDSAVAMTAALTGILYTLIAGKGFRICYFFGVINCICYAILSFEWKLYGEVMLYGGYYLPMMFVGFFSWKKNLQGDKTIIKTRLGNLERVMWSVACLLGIVLYAALLYLIGGRTPGMDSATNVLSAAAMILTVKRCIEQWILWFLVNVISIIMWTRVWFTTGEASSIIFMYLIFLFCGIFFYFSWKKSYSTKAR